MPASRPGAGPRSRATACLRRCRGHRRAGPGQGLRSSGVAELHARIRDVALGAVHDDVVAIALAEQRLRDRRLDADPALLDVRFVWPDDPIGDLFTFLVFERDIRSEEHARRIARWFADDRQLIEPLAEKAHAA